MWVLRKARGLRCYQLEPTDCYPQRMPWATRQIRVQMKEPKGSEPRDYTLVDYLSLPQPRSSHPEAALARLIEGHGHQLDPVRGAQHWEVPVARGLELVAELRRRLPGFGVPRYVREVVGAAHKVELGPEA